MKRDFVKGEYLVGFGIIIFLVYDLMRYPKSFKQVLSLKSLNSVSFFLRQGLISAQDRILHKYAVLF